MLFRPLSDWDKIEKLFFNLVQNKLAYEAVYSTNEFEFLVDIGFVTHLGRTITEAGDSYYILKFVDKNDDVALELLSNYVKKLRLVQVICQQFYDKDNATKEQVENLLLRNGYNKHSFPFNADSFLAFLDKCKILSFRKGKINILSKSKAGIPYNSKTKSMDIKTVSISPHTPYTNGELKWRPEGSKKAYDVKDLLGTANIRRREEELLEEILYTLKTRREEEKLDEIVRILREIADESDNEETLREKINKVIVLQPNILGFGFNFNEAISLYFKRKRKSK